MKKKVIYENEVDFRIPSGKDYEKEVATSIRRRQRYELKDMTLTSTTEYVIGGMKYKVNSIFDMDAKDSEEALKRLMEKEIDIEYIKINHVDVVLLDIDIG